MNDSLTKEELEKLLNDIHAGEEGEIGKATRGVAKEELMVAMAHRKKEKIKRTAEKLLGLKYDLGIVEKGIESASAEISRWVMRLTIHISDKAKIENKITRLNKKLNKLKGGEK